VIVVIDYGMGNVGSVVNMISKVGAVATASADPAVIRQAKKIILPGVGAFDSAMTRLRELGLVELLNESVLARQVPILGICLGMQVMGLSSEEGVESGFGWIKATTRKFSFDGGQKPLRVPHMGWNLVHASRACSLLEEMADEPRFYFVHSYHVCCDDIADIMLTTHYGIDFVSGIRKGNIYGVQFHPEKSHKFGMRLIRNFLERVEC
jgi:glutamine amidotransferase